MANTHPQYAGLHSCYMRRRYRKGDTTLTPWGGRVVGIFGPTHEEMQAQCTLGLDL